MCNFDGAISRGPLRNRCQADLRTTAMISERKNVHHKNKKRDRVGGPSAQRTQRTTSKRNTGRGTHARSPSRTQGSVTAAGQCHGCRAASRLLHLTAAARQWEPPELYFWSPPSVLYAWCSSSARVEITALGLSHQRGQKARRAHKGCAHPVSRIGTARWAIPTAVLCWSLVS